MSTAQAVSQTLIAALTASVNDDSATGATLRAELLANYEHADVIEASLGLSAALLKMFGPDEKDGILRQLAKWVAEMD